MNVAGIVVSGQGLGTAATQLPWFRRAVAALYGFDPYPGTMNVRTGAAEAVESALLASGAILVPPTKYACAAFLLPAQLHLDGLTPTSRHSRHSGIQVVLVRPLVAGYDRQHLELVADQHLRSRLGLTDGDSVVLSLSRKQAPSWFQA